LRSYDGIENWNISYLQHGNGVVSRAGVREHGNTPRIALEPGLIVSGVKIASEKY